MNNLANQNNYQIKSNIIFIISSNNNTSADSRADEPP